MKLRTLPSDFNVQGKRVLIRIDANVPVKQGKAVDGPHGRIARAAVDINYLAHRGAKVIVLSHMGRPEGRHLSAYSLKPVAKRLSELLGSNVKFSKTIVGAAALKAVKSLKHGDVLLLENMRFDRREETNDITFAKALAELGEVYINDAFGVSHRVHASIHRITKELPSFAGPLLANEIAVLAPLEKQAKKPFVLVMGGVKMETKLPVLKRLAPHVDAMLLGGALATTVLAQRGYEVGKSVHDKETIHLDDVLPKTALKKLLLPIDVVVATSMRKDAKVTVKQIEHLEKTDVILDIGPETIVAYSELIERAKTIVWNGPLGYCEMDTYGHGTHAIAQAIADRTGSATTVVGGGDTMPMLEKMHIADKFTLLSTGGGAMLAFLATGTLPCLEVLT